MSDELTYRRRHYAVRGGVIYRDGVEITARALLAEGNPTSALWSWLRAKGIRRPSPSGASGPSGRARHDGQTRVDVWLDADLVERARRVAAERGVDMRTLIEDAVRAAMVGR